METEFTPMSSFLGGMLIGCAALILMAAHGRIAGISGIFSRWLMQSDSDSRWGFSVNSAFLIGLLLGLPVTTLFLGATPDIQNDSPFIAMLMAGLLVGYGTAHGNGCTSGHGVCGISRLSVRSMIATATFLATGVITTFVMRHVVGG